MMKKSNFLLLLFLLNGFVFYAQFNLERRWGAYLGNATLDKTSQAIDLEGNVYVAGRLRDFTTSSAINFITTDAFQTTPGRGFVMKINSQGTVVWGTYINGTVENIAIDTRDNQNEIVILGYANNDQVDGATVIASPGAYQAAMDGQGSLFLLKFDVNGNRIWGTYYNTGGIGINNSTSALSLGIDSTGSIYFSHRAGYATLGTVGTFQPTQNETNPTAISKFSADGNKIWTTYYGINGSSVQSISINATGLFIKGNTKDCFPYNNPNTYFATAGAYQPTTLGNCTTQYLSKFSFEGQRLWSTYFKFLGFIKAGEGGVYLTSQFVTNPNLITPGTFQQDSDASSGYLGKFDDLGQRVWGTYVGLNGGVNALGAELDVDVSGNVFLFGTTSHQSNIATTDGFLAVNPSFNNYSSGFAMKFNPSGQRLWGTYYGCGQDTYINSIMYAETGFYMLGTTICEEGIATAGSVQSEYIVTPAPLVPFNTFVARFGPAPLSNDQNDFQGITIFPNPNQGVFTISNLKAPAVIEVYDMLGKKVHEQNINNNQEIRLHNVSKGIYFAKIGVGKELYRTEKMVVK